jgi:hypothetical protein
MQNPNSYPPAVAELLSQLPLAPLGPGTPEQAVRGKLAALNDAVFGRVVDRGAAACCRAGLWLAFNFLNESHSISQEDEGHPDRDFWHAIMHRREPDAFNSKYWWRRVGSHPVLDQLREQAPSLGYTFTSPEAFVDFCEKNRGTGSEQELLAKRVQHLEWQLLFDWCWRKATGG